MVDNTEKADFERERLGLLQNILDPITLRRLDQFGDMWGWRCLEVGSGENSVARMLAERVGSSGYVVATDIEPRSLVGNSPPNLELRRHNILEDAIEVGTYDLVHCRAVLMHVKEPERAVQKMAEAVRP